MSPNRNAGASAKAYEARVNGEAAPNSRIVRSGAGETEKVSLVGGKGKGLLSLDRLGLAVPSFFIIGTEVFREVVARLDTDLNEILTEAAKVDPKADGAASDVEDLASKASELILGAGLGAQNEELILSEFDRSFGRDGLVAVRSSVVGEDSLVDSFAGQMDSYLFVSRDQLIKQVLACLASAFGERALLYRALRSRLEERIDVAVVVQQMVDSRVAGVVFTANPMNGDRSEAIVSAALGLGEGLVSGQLDADSYHVDKASLGVKKARIARKCRRVVPGSGEKGTVVEDTPPELANAPALTDPEVESVVHLALRIETEAGLPQDIEWAFDRDGRLFLLQARPITSLDMGRVTIFDNSNIVESYPGISSPLTFSFVRHMYEVAFREGLRQLAGKAVATSIDTSVLANLIGLVDGRIYYNILNWYRLFQCLGLEKALPTFEKTLGIDDSFRPALPSRAQRLKRLPKDILVRANLLLGFTMVDARASAYLRNIARIREKVLATDLDSLDAHSLVDLFEYCAEHLAGPYGVAIANDFYAQQFHEIARKLLEAWGCDEPDTLRNRLMMGEDGMQSVDPLQSLLALADRARSDESLKILLESDLSDEDVWRAIDNEDALQDFARSAREHLDLYGDRRVHELKLETPSLEENPELFVATLRNLVREEREMSLFDNRRERREAEREVSRHLLWRPLRRVLFKLVLRRARAGLRHRENLRLARSRGFGLVKRIFRALGRCLAALDLIDEPEDVFWLTLEEAIGSVRGHITNKNLRRLILLRKEEWDGHAQSSPAPRVEFHGPVLSARSVRALHPERERTCPVVTNELHGIGCCPGRVRAPAKVVLEPRHDMPISGEILVAPMTDPGWVFLMAAASGLIVERGSLLSHTAIIGRELGIPTVVSVEDATRSICDGMLIELDGGSGTIRVLEGEEACG